MKHKFKSDRENLAGTLLKEGDYESIRQVIERIDRYVPENKIFGSIEKSGNIFYYTAHEVYEEMMNLGDGLLSEGFEGRHIAIVAENSCRYVIADMTIASGVGVVIPIDKDAPKDLLRTLLIKCDADAVLCSASVLGRIQSVSGECPRLKTIITIDKQVEGLLSYDDLIDKGRRMRNRSIFRHLSPDLNAPAKILFTSGTTGANKGVILTNANLAANFMNCLGSIRAEVGNISMSVLPMHHATEINTHIMTRVAGGNLTYINDSMRNMMTNIKIFQPSCITVVPMIANAFYKAIWKNAEQAGKADKLRMGIKLSNLLRKFGIDRTHEMFAEVFAPFGGKLNMIVCGGSMLNPVVVKGLNDLGIRIENGYGITECGPLISMNADTLKEHLSVGLPCDGIEVRIDNADEDGIGELCVKGKSVAKGYYKDEQATAQVFGEDGFFNTGDSAWIDASGRIFLVGRKKNTIVLENGKNVNPEEIENVIETNLDYVKDIVVYQADQKLCAGLFIEDESKRSDRAAILADIKRVNSLMPSYKAIDFVELPDKEYEKTSTKKIKRTELPTECSEGGLRIY